METLEFFDFDAFAGSVSGVDSKMLLRDPERRSWTIDRVELPGLEIQIGRLGSGNIASGHLDVDGCMLYLPLTPGIEYRGNGKVVDRDSFFILERGAEFCLTTNVAHDWCAVTIPNDQLARYGFQSRARSCRVARRNPVAANRLRDIVTNVMSAAATYPDFERSQAAAHAATTALEVLRPIAGQRLTETQPATGRPKVSRDEIIQRSLAILQKQQPEYPSVAELALASDVSERTLRTAFQDYFELGPSRYLQLRQLNNVHHALRSADPDHKTVAQILSEHGVWAFGRFASRYSDLFGEQPSVTLRS